MPYKDMPFVRDNYLQLPNHRFVKLGSSAWFSWLEQASRFCYQPVGTVDRLTLRKEKRRHHFYWYAYLKRDAKLHNAYVGRTETLTAPHLDQVAFRLVAKASAYSRALPVA